MKPALIVLPHDLAQDLISEGLAKPNEIIERRGVGALQPITVVLRQHGTDIVNLVGQGLINKAAVDPIYNAVAQKLGAWWQQRSGKDLKSEDEHLKLEACWPGGRLSLEVEAVDVNALDAIADFLRQTLDE